jgi:hypothetical protein
VGEVAVLRNAEEDNGGTVLATTVSPETCTDAEILQADPEQPTTVAPGLRWSKHPAAISPVCLEKPARIAALALLTVSGFLVYTVLQRQVRLSLHRHDPQVPGHKGPTATPTAAVVVAWFSQIALGQCWIGEQEVKQVYGGQPSHLLLCEALGLDSSWYAVSTAQKSAGCIQAP